MRVEIKVSKEVKEPYAVIYVNELTDDVQKICTMLESNEKVITVSDSDRIIIIKPEEIYMARTEASDVNIYCKNKKYRTKKRLYELENLLGNDFMRISKSTIVNLKSIECVEQLFNGMMLLVMRNGCKDYISRRYLPEFKKYLGI